MFKIKEHGANGWVYSSPTLATSYSSGTPPKINGFNILKTDLARIRAKKTGTLYIELWKEVDKHNTFIGIFYTSNISGTPIYYFTRSASLVVPTITIQFSNSVLKEEFNVSKKDISECFPYLDMFEGAIFEVFGTHSENTGGYYAITSITNTHYYFKRLYSYSNDNVFDTFKIETSSELISSTSDDLNIYNTFTDHCLRHATGTVKVFKNGSVVLDRRTKLLEPLVTQSDRKEIYVLGIHSYTTCEVLKNMAEPFGGTILGAFILKNTTDTSLYFEPVSNEISYIRELGLSDVQYKTTVTNTSSSAILISYTDSNDNVIGGMIVGEQETKSRLFYFSPNDKIKMSFIYNTAKVIIEGTIVHKGNRVILFKNDLTHKLHEDNKTKEFNNLCKRLASFYSIKANYNSTECSSSTTLVTKPKVTKRTANAIFI